MCFNKLFFLVVTSSVKTKITQMTPYMIIPSVVRSCWCSPWWAWCAGSGAPSMCSPIASTCCGCGGTRDSPPSSRRTGSSNFHYNTLHHITSQVHLPLLHLLPHRLPHLPSRPRRLPGRGEYFAKQDQKSNRSDRQFPKF